MKWIGTKRFSLIIITLLSLYTYYIAHPYSISHAQTITRSPTKAPTQLDPNSVLSALNALLQVWEHNPNAQPWVLQELIRIGSCAVAGISSADCAQPIVSPGAIGTPSPGYGTGFPTPGLSNGSWPFFCQTNPALQDARLSPPLNNYGCGQTSLAMAACKSHGYDNSSKESCPFQPAQVALKGMEYGSYKYPSGTYFNSGYIRQMAEAGLEYNILPLNLVIWQQFINNGYVIITHSRRMPCGVGCRDPNRLIGHVFVVDQVQPFNQAMRLRDPNGCIYAGNGAEYYAGGRWMRWGEFVDKPVVVYAVRKRV